MRKIEIKDLNDNFFEAIGKEWMLVTAGYKDNFNLMTASWGGIGWAVEQARGICVHTPRAPHLPVQRTERTHDTLVPRHEQEGKGDIQGVRLKIGTRHKQG